MKAVKRGRQKEALAAKPTNFCQIVLNFVFKMEELIFYLKIINIMFSMVIYKIRTLNGFEIYMGVFCKRD